MARRIEDYALIGDCETAALIGRDGSIDWLCWPRFDSEACFAALLGTPENGRWLIAPAEPGMRVERRYRDGTLILETDFETSQGAVTLIDFMPTRDDSSDLIRIVIGRAGEVRMRMELVFRFDYGRLVPWVDARKAARYGPSRARTRRLCTPTCRTRAKTSRRSRSSRSGRARRLPFILAYRQSHLPPPKPIDPGTALPKRRRCWQRLDRPVLL